MKIIYKNVVCFNLLLFTIYFKVVLLNMLHALTIVIHYASSQVINTKPAFKRIVSKCF